MLWGVGQGLRHLRPVTASLSRVRGTTLHTTPPAVRDPPHAFGLRWLSAAAVQELTRRSTRTPPKLDLVIPTPSPAPSPAPSLPDDADQGKRPRKSRERSPRKYPSVGAMLEALFESSTLNVRKDILRKSKKDGSMPEVFDALNDRDKATKLAVSMAKDSNPQQALRVLILAHESKYSFRQNAYETVAHELASDRHWHLIPPLVDLGKKHTGRTSVRLLNWLARAFIELREFAALDSIVDRFKSEEVKPNRRTYHLLISGHLRNHDLFRARRCVVDMETAGFAMDESTHAIIISSYRALGSNPTITAKAMEVLKNGSGAHSTTVLNTLLQLSLDAHDMPQAMQSLSMFDSHSKDDAVRPDHAEDITRRDGELLSSPDQVRPESEPPRPSLVPKQDAATFTILIHHLGKDGDLSRIQQVLEQMQASGVRPDSSTAAALVKSFFVAKQPDTAIQIIADMYPEQHRAQRLLRNLGSGDATSRKPRILPDGLPVTAEVLNALLQGALGTRGLKGMRVVQRLMHISRVNPDEHTLEIFLSHLERVERVTPSGLARLTRRLHSPSLRPSLRYLHIILRTVMRQEIITRRVYELEGGPALVADTRGTHNPRDDWDPGPGFLNAVMPPTALKHRLRLSHRALVRRLLDDLYRRRIKSDRATFALRIRHDAVIKRDTQMATQSFQAMLDRGLHPNEYHYSALMEGHIEAEDMDSAEEVMRKAARAGIRPNVTMYNLLVVGYARQKNPDEALRVFREMVAADISPDMAIIHALTSAFCAIGAYKVARRLLMQLWSCITVIPENLRDAPLRRLMKAMGSLARSLERLSKQKRRMLRWKLRRLVKGWTRKNRGSSPRV